MRKPSFRRFGNLFDKLARATRHTLVKLRGATYSGPSDRFPGESREWGYCLSSRLAEADSTPNVVPPLKSIGPRPCGKPCV